MAKPKPKQFGLGKIKSKQVSGVAEYPTVTLSPCQFSEGVGWYCPPPLLLCVGAAFELSGVITFAPAIIPPLKMLKFGVWIQFDTFDEDALFLPRLLYYDNDENVHQQIASGPVDGGKDKFFFNIPTHHISREGWFTCALKIDLLTPLVGEQRQIKMRQGQENPCQPVILRGAWVEVQGE